MATSRVVSTERGDARHAISPIRVYSDGAGSVYIDLTTLYRVGQINMGIQIQAITANITPNFTMEAVEIALDPARREVLPTIWRAYTQVTAGSFGVFTVGATAVKLTFSGAGEAIIAAL